MNNAFKIKKGLIVNGDGGTIVDILGSQGQLFSVTDSLTGVLMSVNDISGIPILEVSSDNTVKLGTFGSEGLIVSGSTVNLRTPLTTGPITHIPVFSSDPSSGSTLVESITLSNLLTNLNAVPTGRTLTLSGTTNQVNISSPNVQDLSADRTWTLSLPQDIHTGATPTFAGMTVNGSIGLRASATSSVATHIPVFTQDPSSTTRTLVTRTPAQLLGDIGAGTVTSIVTENGITGGTITTTGTLGLTGQALALHNLGTNGFIVRTGSGTVSARTITGSTSISVTNGNGVDGNPILTAIFGSTSGTVAQGNDSRFHDAVTLGINQNGLSLSGQVLSLGLASTSLNGALSSTDWNTFNGKENVLTFSTGLSRSGNTITNTITQYTDALARASISLTTTGTTGSATYNSTTGVFNIPQYQAALTNPVTGTGTSGQVSFWTGTTTQTGDSNLFWNNTDKRLGIGTNVPTQNLDVNGVGLVRTRLTVGRSSEFDSSGSLTAFGSGKNLLIIQTSDNTLDRGIAFRNSGAAYIGYISIVNTGSNLGNMVFGVSSSTQTDVNNVNERLIITSTGNIGINTTSPTNTLDVDGTTRIRTINNGIGDFLTVDSNGVLTKRTSAQLFGDIGAVPTGRTLTLSGTTNQVNISSPNVQDLSANRTWTLSLPQNIHTGATPTFAGLTVNGTITTNTLVVGTQASKATISYTTNTARTLTIPTLGGDRTFSFINQDETINSVKTFTSVPILPNGSATAPSLRFTTESNLGIYRSGANVLSITTSGTQRVSVSDNGLDVISGFLQSRTRLSVGANLDPNRGPILTGTITNGGSGYTNGTYTNVPVVYITGSSGLYARLTVTVSGGVVTNVVISWGGHRYLPNEVISVTDANLGGGGGSGFEYTINTVQEARIYVTDSGGSTIRLERNSTSVVAGQIYGSLWFSARDSSNFGSGDLTGIQGIANGNAGGGRMEFFAATNAQAPIRVLTLNSTLATYETPILVPAGTVSAPAIRFNGDTNTGMYWIDANNLGFTQNGTNRLTIGTTGITVNGTLILGTQTSKATISYTTNQARTYTIPDAGTNADFVMTAGAQTIAGTKTFSDATIINNNLSLRASATSSVATHIPVFTQDPSSTTRTLVTRTPAQLLGDIGAIGGSGTENIIPRFSGTRNIIDSVIYQSGTSIGIGSAPVNAKLFINATTGGNNGIRIITDNNVNGFLQFGDTDNNSVGRIIYKHIDDSMGFFTNSTEKLSITSAGDIGINTTTPTEKLDIDGNIRVRTLGTTPGDIVTANSNGVLSRRTSAQLLGDIGAVPTGRTLTLSGTTNQINISSPNVQDLSANRTWTLSLPQNIHTGATPTFAGLTVNGNITLGGSVQRQINMPTSIIRDNGAQALILSVNSGSIFLRPVGDSSTTGQIEITETVTQYTGARTIRTTTGDLTIATLTGDGNIILSPHGNGQIQVNAPIGIRASTGSTATHIPIFTANPATTTRTLVTRTPAQLLGDIGAVPTGRTLTLTGTTNQINISSPNVQDLSANRTWTLSLPQNIHTGATPTFAGLTVNGNINGNNLFIPIAGYFGSGTGASDVWIRPIADGLIYNIATGDDHLFRVNNASQFKINVDGIYTLNPTGGLEFASAWKLGNATSNTSNNVTRTIRISIDGVQYDLLARIVDTTTTTTTVEPPSTTTSTTTVVPM